MKTVKNCTAGIAVLLCILICIYALTLYLKFTPDEEPEILEDGTEEELPSKLEQFLDSNVNAEEHLTLALMLAVSAFIGFVLEKLPALGMLSSACTLAYSLTMLRFEALPKFPRTVVVLCIAHAAGAIFYAATSERGRKSFLGLNSAASGALLCNTAAIGISIYLYRVLNSFGSTEEKIAEIKEAGIVVSAKLAAIPDFIDMMHRTLQVRGVAQARRLLSDVSKQYPDRGIIDDTHMTYAAEESTLYLKLAILLFGVVILAFVFRRRAWIGACLCAIPTLSIFGSIMNDKLSTMTLTLLTLTFIASIGAYAAYQREGAPALVDEDGEEIESADEDDPLPEELPASDAEDDSEGDLVTDWECSKLDYFYENPAPAPISESERDEYLEIEGEADGDQEKDPE